ncbi:hypothetical protein [Pseudomonas phage LUZ7]|uniref:Uncharacterized protein n=1 Tax=Pseudomonas phage LUZ7 TaxID=655097 RepID=C8ZKB0_9CAUD|nr:hypothetical protein PP-LUZ7_gp011 [Pseudomonas phage LUZ7]CAZ66152.1 hypothetical protein [Pseudomonas phage LUZ7]
MNEHTQYYLHRANGELLGPKLIAGPWADIFQEGDMLMAKNPTAANVPWMYFIWQDENWKNVKEPEERHRLVALLLNDE